MHSFARKIAVFMCAFGICLGANLNQPEKKPILRQDTFSGPSSIYIRPYKTDARSATNVSEKNISVLLVPGRSQ